MSHGYHEGQPGYDPAQILHDGCLECAQRSERSDRGLSTLDLTTFRLAWTRAAAWYRNGLPNLSHAERPLLEALWSVQVQLEKAGWPIGTLPGERNILVIALPDNIADNPSPEVTP